MNQVSKDVKKPDQFLVFLRRIFDAVVDRAALVVAALALILVAGGAYATWSHFAEQKELQWVEKYAAVEREYLEKKRQFLEAAQREQMRKSDPKAAVPAGVLPTGDLARDYGTVTTDFQALIDEAPKTRAAEMAALNTAVLYAEYNQKEKALDVLNQVNTSNRTRDLLGALIVNVKASLMASQDRCPEAVSLFEKITQDKRAGFLHQEAKLRTGLCYEKMNEMAKAEEIYKSMGSDSSAENVSPSAEGQNLGEDAERYLRLLRMKQSERGS